MNYRCWYRTHDCLLHVQRKATALESYYYYNSYSQYHGSHCPTRNLHADAIRVLVACY